MKININFLNKWSGITFDVKELTKKLTSVGFETFVENNVLHITIPYNRQDCGNVFGIIDEISKFFEIKDKRQISINYDFKNPIKIKIINKKFCPLFYGVTVKNINNNIETPSYIKKTLNDNNINLSNFIINITNYTALITGQPLHVYDLNKINETIIVNSTKTKQKFTSLKKKIIKLDKNIDIISDKNNIIAIPGIIGSYETKISTKTTSIFLESAIFNSKKIDYISRKYNVKTFASKNFINGVNFNLTEFALKYTILLLRKIQKIHCSNIIKIISKRNLPKEEKINLHKKKLYKIFGYKIKENHIENILKKIKLNFLKFEKHWKVFIPYYRKDLLMEENIISEIIKIYDFNNISYIPIKTNQVSNISSDKTQLKKKQINNLLIENGFTEIITYSFIDYEIEKKFSLKNDFFFLKNPMVNNLSIMRSNLFQGLMKTLRLNFNRGYNDIKLYEFGKVFIKKKNINTELNLSGVCTEDKIYKQKQGYVDTNFFIIKNLIEKICQSVYGKYHISYNSGETLYLDKKINSDIFVNKKKIGIIGLVDKKILKTFSIKKNIYFFNIKIENIKNQTLYLKKISKYPKIKRDTSFILDNNILYNSVILFINSLNIENLRQTDLLSVFFFEKCKKKSFTLRFTFQSFKETLLDEKINLKILFIQEKIKIKFKAEIKKIDQKNNKTILT